MKKLFALMFCAAALLCSSCSKDDSEESLPVTEANLVGTWELYKTYDGEYDEWDYAWGEAYGCVDMTEFKSDGTYIGYGYELEPNSDHVWEYENGGTYTLEGTTLTMIDSEEPDDIDISKIEKLTATELVASYTYEGYGWDSEEGKIYTSLAYWKRVK